MQQNRKHGFTLIELSVVLLVLSLMLGGILTIVTQTARIEKRNQLNAKIERIKTAMMDFRLGNKRLPCPGDSTLITSYSNFGREGDSPGDCAGGALASTFADAGANVYGGSVPVRTLGLTDDDAYDPWGNLFLYAVDKRITDTTANNPFSAYPTTHSSIGNITVRDADAGGEVITSRALYVLVSHGQNGHGAYMRSGNRKSTGSTNTRELANCDCTAAAVAGTFDSTFYRGSELTNSANALNAFDDTVMFFFRSDLLSSAEADAETIN
ncbi:MAG: prepilin-type N-terminal cleavage/methylation domain-containing protein [Alphaproteobacteria bacterium]